MNLCTEARPLAERHRGWTCAACQVPLAPADLVRECTSCGAPQHDRCWERAGACKAYACRAADAPAAAGGSAPAAGAEPIRISTADVKDVHVETLNLPPGVGQGNVHIARYVRRRTSRLAIAACILGVLAVPLFGVTGIFAVVLGGIALATVFSDRAQKGAVWAAVGMALGLFATVGWVLYLILYHWNRDRATDAPRAFESHFTVADAPPEVRGAMERNVRIAVGNRWGSGIVLTSAGARCRVLTNRHVVDARFEEDPRSPTPRVTESAIQIQFHTGVTTPGRVEWVAPDGVDLVLLSCPLEGLTIAPAPMDKSRPLRIGDEVYAVGNPGVFDWTYTRGVVSAFRSLPAGDHQVRVIQTQTPISPGNSGGGLYDMQGYLVGVNTWKAGRGSSEGLNFAISIQTAQALLEAWPEWK